MKELYDFLNLVERERLDYLFEIYRETIINEIDRILRRNYDDVIRVEDKVMSTYEYVLDEKYLVGLQFFKDYPEKIAVAVYFATIEVENTRSICIEDKCLDWCINSLNYNKGIKNDPIYETVLDILVKLRKTLGMGERLLIHIMKYYPLSTLINTSMRC